MIIKTSTTLPWWTRDNENRPDITVLTNFKNKMVDKKLRINWVDELNITVILDKNPVIDDNAVKYIYVEKDGCVANYYYFTKLLRIANNRYVCAFTLDIYCTYTINFLYHNWEKNFTLMRTPNFELESLEYEDTKLDAVPKFYNSVSFKRKEYFYDVDNFIWYGRNGIGIRGNDLVNANRYFVFKDGINGGYKFFPIMSKKYNIEVFTEEYDENSKELIDTIEFKTGRFSDYIENKHYENLPAPSDDGKIKEYWEKGKFIEYYYRSYIWKYVFPEYKPIFNEWKKVDYVPYGTLPKHFRIESSMQNYFGVGLRELYIRRYMLGTEMEGSPQHFWNITSGAFDDAWGVGDTSRNMVVKVYNAEKIYRNHTVKNSLEGLETLRKNENYINKFLGIYYLPNILSFKNLNFETIHQDTNINNYVYININPLTGENVFLDLYQYGLNNIEGYFNNPNYSNGYLLKYLDIKYYGNKVNAEFRLNNTYNIYLDGKLYFTDCASIIAKSSNLISLNEATFSYPYMLPYGTSEYEKYVSANRSVMETGFSIAKRQQDLSVAQWGVGIGMGVADAAANAAMTIATAGMGSFVSMGSAIPYNGAQLEGKMFDSYAKVDDGINNKGKSAIGGSAMDIAHLGIDSAFSAVNQINSMQNMIDKNVASYKQARQTKGNNINFSSIDVAALQFYYNDDGGQYEGVEIKDLTPATLSLLNNMLLLYGYFLPKLDTIKNRLDEAEDFTFIQIDSLNLNELINIDWFNIGSNFIYKLMKAELENGIRIWKKDNINIKNWTPDLQNKVDLQDTGLIKPSAPTALSPVENKLILEFNEITHLNNTYSMIYTPQQQEQDNRTFSLFGLELAGHEQSNPVLPTDKIQLVINNKTELWPSQPEYIKYISNKTLEEARKAKTWEINLPNLTSINWDFYKTKILCSVNIANDEENPILMPEKLIINTPKYTLPEEIAGLQISSYLKNTTTKILIWNGRKLFVRWYPIDTTPPHNRKSK